MQKQSSYQKNNQASQIIQTDMHLITINGRNNELGKIYLAFKRSLYSKKGKLMLNDKQISTLKKAIADIDKTGESQLKNLLTELLYNNNIHDTSTLNNEQISVVFLNGLKDLYGKYVKAELKKANNMMKEVNNQSTSTRQEKQDNSCCSIF